MMALLMALPFDFRASPLISSPERDHAMPLMALPGVARQVTIAGALMPS